MRRLTWSHRLVCTVLALLIAEGGISSALAQGNNSGSVMKLKSGKCVFKLLGPDGVKVLRGAELRLEPVNNRKNALTATSDKAGKCELNAKPGKYVLTVNGMDLATVEFTDDAKHTECRVVVPPDRMIAGPGTEEEKKKKRTVAWWGKMRPFVIGGAIVLTAAGTYKIWDNNRGSDGEPASP